MIDGSANLAFAWCVPLIASTNSVSRFRFHANVRFDQDEVDRGDEQLVVARRDGCQLETSVIVGDDGLSGGLEPDRHAAYARAVRGVHDDAPDRARRLWRAASARDTRDQPQQCRQANDRRLSARWEARCTRQRQSSNLTLRAPA